MCEDPTATGPDVENCAKSPSTLTGKCPSSVKGSPHSPHYSSSPSAWNSDPSSSTEKYSSPSSPIKRYEEESQSPRLNPNSLGANLITAKKLPEEAIKRKKLEDIPAKLATSSPLSVVHSSFPASSTFDPRWSPGGALGTPCSSSFVSSTAVPPSPFQNKYFQVRQHTLCRVSHS